MKESFQEQLARVAKSSALYSTASEPLSQASRKDAHPVSSGAPQITDRSYEGLINEIDNLRASKEQLAEELKLLKAATPRDELTALQLRLSEALDSVRTAEHSNDLLAEQIARLKQEHEGVPTPEEISRLREMAKNAERHLSNLSEATEQLARDRRQLELDRVAFESELDQLEELNEATRKLAADRQDLLDKEAHIRERFAEAERIEKRLTKERERLDKQAIELAELQSKVGHLKRIEEDFKALQDEYSRITRLYESSKTRIRNLKSEVAEAIDNGQKADANAKRLSRELKVAVNKLATLPNGEVVFRSFETVQWVVSQFFDPKERLVPKRILLIGDGPWPIDDFTVLLEGLGFDVWQNGCDANIEVVVVGRDNWSESIVDGQVEDRDGKSLRMYSQELFVLLLAMQADPLEVAQPEALLSFVHGHPVFEYLFSQEFPWPESAYDDSPPTTVGEGFDGEDASSPLYKMGYSVAQNVDLAPSQRHAILEKAYAESDLPWCISDAYMDDWGAANSRKRLRRIAWHLHIMSRRFRRHQEAVARWESDLAWLKRTRYKSIHRFRWPS